MGTPPCTAELLWTRIFAFATSPGHPDSFNVSHLTNRAALLIINSTRKSLTLVSKQFYVSFITMLVFLLDLAFAETVTTISFSSTAFPQR